MGSATLSGLALVIFMGFWPAMSKAQYVSNQAHCLSVDTTNNTSSMAFLENRCGYELNVKYCFGLSNCHTNPGATTVPARDKKTIYHRHREEGHLQLIAFACRGDVDFTDCQKAKEQFFRSRIRN
ncbi:hypothetical protein [Wenzhouxiangella sp. EGI_FJ10305]|uniref:hypothetical protein n=1 Tax=Wenzhouxiangella sp. EGI_FJ10305 TaxID=3243768 RepID=UPI0035D6599D